MAGNIQYEDSSFFSFIDEETNIKNNKSVNSKSNINNEIINVGDSVKVKYDGIEYIGKVVHTYYDGAAINVVFNNKYATFHISHVKKVYDNVYNVIQKYI